MTPATIIKEIKADGIMLALSPAGSLLAVGSSEAIRR